MSQRFLILDYETRSEADLTETGGYEYSLHPSTQILCAAWRLGTREELRTAPIRVWTPATPSDLINELTAALLDPNVILVAHNAFFEQVITRNVLPKFLNHTRAFTAREITRIPSSRWACTASLGSTLALPRKLEEACKALKLPVQKDMEGHRLMLKYSKPRKATKHNKSKWHSKLRDLKRIMKYNGHDIEAETELFLACPPLSALERKVWLLDQKINFHGVHVDREAVDKVLKMIDEELEALTRETQTLSGGVIRTTSQLAVMLEWLTEQGVGLPNLKAKTVQDALLNPAITGKARRMLEIRRDASKTSTKKYLAFELRSRSDSRVRDLLVYHGASTGRWSGAGLQPQNFPRGTIKDTLTATEIIGTGDLELVRLIYKTPMEAFSSCLRSMIDAPAGYELFCGDWSAIETRVLFWVAKHVEGLKALRDPSRDIYREMAAEIVNKKLESVTKGDRDNLGKPAILGLGYQMGWKKFQGTCQDRGSPVSDELAQTAVNVYREIHFPIVQLWWNVQNAAIAAVENPGKAYKVNSTVWWVEKNFLWCKLPSGRKLAYYGPSIRHDKTPWGEPRPTLYHYGIDRYAKKGEPKWKSMSTYGGRLVENIVQAIARDFMVHGMLALDEAGYRINITVHDEILADRKIGEGDLKEFERLMVETPPWGGDIPMKVEAWKGQRYRK